MREIRSSCYAGVQAVYVFFFQAEDGIRDIGVTGVQTCALPIFCLAGLVTLGHSFSRSGNFSTPTDFRKARRIVRCSRMVEFCRSARRVGTFARSQSINRRISSLVTWLAYGFL